MIAIRAVSRGIALSGQEYAALGDSIDIPFDAKERLASLTPARHIGLAIDIARQHS